MTPFNATEHCQGQEEMGGDASDLGLKTHSAKDLHPFLQGCGDERVALQEQDMEGDRANG
jgi:hypothetical protein